MKKQMALAAIAAGSILLATASFATGKTLRGVIMNPTTTKAPTVIPIMPIEPVTILDIKTITPQAAEIKADEIVISAGENCGGLTTIFDVHSYPHNEIFIDNDEYAVPGMDLADLVGYNMGCFKMDVTANGKTVSTGPIALTWSEQVEGYIAAKPSSVIMDFS